MLGIPTERCNDPGKHRVYGRLQMKGILRSPLLHFFAIGAGIYLLYGLYGAPTGETGSKRLTVTAAAGYRNPDWSVYAVASR